MTKVKQILEIIFGKKIKEDDKVKIKWSLKKKLLLAGGVLGGVVLGIFTYGKATEDVSDNDNEMENEDFEFEFEDDLNDSEIVEDVEIKVEVETKE